ncbi:MAG: hypothetical protein AAF394_02220 [Planctomycetota bacterium]
MHNVNVTVLGAPAPTFTGADTEALSQPSMLLSGGQSSAAGHGNHPAAVWST